MSKGADLFLALKNGHKITQLSKATEKVSKRYYGDINRIAAEKILERFNELGYYIHIIITPPRVEGDRNTTKIIFNYDINVEIYDAKKLEELGYEPENMIRVLEE